MKYVSDPSKPGYVEARTGRVAVLAKDYANSDLNGDAAAYSFNAEAEELGIDPWRLVEGVDQHTSGDSMDVWFANGTYKTVGLEAVLFLSAADAAKLQH